ncbi:hypothetical protein MMC14_010743, partial [Varicellaria rhodocarpa]|nr:hypothetical protein [Varicellaria rhodocarpa]
MDHDFGFDDAVRAVQNFNVPVQSELNNAVHQPQQPTHNKEPVQAPTTLDKPAVSEEHWGHITNFYEQLDKLERE